MKLWLQIILCLGIVSVSAASLSYTWQTWRAYQLEMRAEEICKTYLESKLSNLGDLDLWFGRRQCINMVMGRGEAKKD